jgi:L,D-peptidoglycan transpeptidase YkuD (ErfK/YbiS/YcfS/YnhG family)
VIIVSANGFDTSVATLEAYQRKNGAWTRAFPAMPARIGANGFADDKREGDRATPTGVYPFDGTMYGIASNPGVRYAYHVLRPDDYWNTNPDSPGYNTFQHGPDPGGTSEAMWTFTPQYTHLAVVRYNMPPVPGRGSGIFLHQFGAGATLGCISLARDNLVSILRWLDPGAAPRIVLAPTAALGRY